MAADDLRWRDLSQHEGPAEPAWTHRDPGPTEDQPGTPECTCGTAHPCPRHHHACRPMPTRRCPGTTGCPVLCARLESDDPAPWTEDR